MENKIIAIASDHGGFELKEEVKKYLDENKIKYIDFGTNDKQSVNYPDFAKKVCLSIQNNECYRGLLFCGTGIGMSMAANKQKGIRAACCSDTFSVRYTRLHNDANILCLGGRVVGGGLALDMVSLFINTDFEGGRHAERIEMFE